MKITLKRAEHIVLMDRRPRDQPEHIPRSKRKRKWSAGSDRTSSS